MDNGPAFRSLHLQQICASLGIAVVHSKPYVPQGRGKIERWFRGVRSDFLPGFRGDSLNDLNEALDAWVRNVYHNREHRSTQETPLGRFATHSECLRPAPKDLEDHFRKQARRRVAKDRAVALDGRVYEAPVTLIGKQITLLYHHNDPARIEALHDGQSYGILRTVDLNVNSRAHRQGDTLSLQSEPRPLTSGKLPFGGRKAEQS